jgi:hypothetical protein
MNRIAVWVLLKDKHRWSIEVVWIVFHNHGVSNTNYYISNENSVLGQFAVPVADTGTMPCSTKSITFLKVALMRRY